MTYSGVGSKQTLVFIPVFNISTVQAFSYLLRSIVTYVFQPLLSLSYSSNPEHTQPLLLFTPCFYNTVPPFPEDAISSELTIDGRAYSNTVPQQFPPLSQ